MNVSLTRSQTTWIHEKVRSGHYKSASEVIREALRLSEAMEIEHDALEEMILEGVESGPPERVTAAWWKKLRADCAKARAARQAA